jgi:basic membrane protein A and related proteins
MLVRVAALLAVSVALATSASASGAGRPLRIALVVQIGAHPETSDVSGLLYKGFIRAAHQPGVTGRVVEIGPSGDPSPAIELLVRQRFDVVVTPFFDRPAIASFAARHPRTTFLVPDGPGRDPSAPANELTTVFRPHEAAYLAGYLASLAADRRRGPHAVSAVGGFPEPQVSSLIAGFRAGALAADPHVKVLIGYSHDFVDPSKCAAVAREQIARGSSVVFDVAGACGYGALTTAKKLGVFGVGVDADQSSLGTFVLTSVLKREGAGIEKAVAAIHRHVFPTSGTLVFDYGDGGVSLGTISPRVPRALLRRLERVRAALAAGRIDVPASLR